MPTAQNGDVSIVYERHGEGEPVLFIMGLGGTKEWWQPQIRELKDRFSCIIMDNRGVGESSKPRTGWTLTDMAKDSVAVLDAEGLDRAHVVGVSMGGMIAQHVALEFPERVWKLVLCATTPGLLHAPAAPEVVGLLTKGGTREEIARNTLRVMFTPETIEREKTLVEEMMDLSMKYPAPARGFQNQVQAIIRHDVRKRLHEIDHETLVLTGDRDELVPPRNAEILAGELPHAKLIVLEGTAHGFFMDRAAEANRILADFLLA